MVRPRANSKVELLRKVPLFGGCSKRELAEIARISDEIDLPEGKDLIREGERGRQFFVLTDGTADVRRKGRRISLMGPGDFFGEISLVSDRPTTATVTTARPASALVITPQNFKRLLRDAPSIQTKVLEELARRVPIDY